MLLVVVSFRENNGEQNKIKKIHIRRKKKGVRHTHSITEKGKSEQEMDRRRRQPRCIRQKKGRQRLKEQKRPTSATLLLLSAG